MTTIKEEHKKDVLIGVFNKMFKDNLEEFERMMNENDELIKMCKEKDEIIKNNILIPKEDFDIIKDPINNWFVFSNEGSDFDEEMLKVEKIFNKYF